MVTGKWKYGLIVFTLLIAQFSFAQGHLFSRVKTGSSSVFVGEPVQVSVTVFTSTWFTKGINPGNIKVEGAFTMYFRSVNSTQRINGKTYAGVEMIFNVFPYEENDIEFPSLEIKVESPDEGTSKGVARVIKTEPKKINIKPVPPNIDRNKWIVASNVEVRQNWNGNLKQVKVGDVLERSISRKINGTVAELIPPVVWESILGVSTYPVRGELNNDKSRTGISASRTDGINYLFEKEGELVIPEYVVSWWNPQLKIMQKHTLKEIVINVLPNPDLGMLESIRDSLQVISAETLESAENEKPFTFLGLNWKEFTIAILVLVILIYLLVKGVLKIRRIISIRKENYRNSELFYFRKFEKALKHKNKKMAHLYLYRWLDQLNLREPTIQYFLMNFGTEEILEKHKLELKNSTSKEKYNIVMELNKWKKTRLNFIRLQNNLQKNVESKWINP